MNIYRIRKGVKGWPGMKFETKDNISSDNLLTGTVITTYKNYTDRVYLKEELDIIPKNKERIKII